MIKKINIKNFKKIDHLELDLTQNYELVAPNRYGKSSIADAIAWVLTGKLLDGSSDHMSIKPKHNTKALVEVELILENGTSLKKTYQEKWTRTRGTTETTLTGHETKCEINGEPIPVTKFNDQLLDLFEIKFDGKYKGNLIQLLIDPLHFGLKEEWQERRKLIIDIVGDVTDDEVFAQNKQLEKLKPYMTQAKGKFDAVKKIVNRALKELREKETKLNNQIEGFTGARTVSKDEFEKTQTKLEYTHKRIDDLKRKKDQSEDAALAERNNALSQLQAKAAESKENDMRIYNETFAQRNKDLESIRNQESTTSIEFGHLNNEINQLSNEKSIVINERKLLTEKLKRIEEQIIETRNDWYEVNENVFHTHDHLNCPNCGHDLNGELVAEQEAKFNLDKANRLKELTQKGKDLKAESEQLQQQIVELNTKEDDLNKEIDELKEKVPGFNDKLIKLRNKEKELSESIPPFKPSEETLELEKQYNELKQTPLSVDTSDITSEINDLIETTKELQQIIDTFNAEQINFNRAKALKTELDDVISKIADLELVDALLSEFIRIKLDILKGRVEAVFGDIKIQLVESNIKEGSWNEVCYVLDGQVPYHNTNSAEKIRLGIKVCEALRKHFGVTGLPYIIDNAEQITDRDFSKLTNEQTIAFVADDVEVKHDRNYRPSDMEQNLFTI